MVALYLLVHQLGLPYNTHTVQVYISLAAWFEACFVNDWPCVGCPIVMKLGVRDEHERDCEYAPIQCPNSSKCSIVLKKDLSEHLKNCNCVRCPHHRYK